jgi:hypothetical protein
MEREHNDHRKEGKWIGVGGRGGLLKNCIWEKVIEIIRIRYMESLTGFREEREETPLLESRRKKRRPKARRTKKGSPPPASEARRMREVQ